MRKGRLLSRGVRIALPAVLVLVAAFFLLRGSSPVRPLNNVTVFLAGDSRSSTDYTFYRELLEEKSGCTALTMGASGRTAAYNASDEYFALLAANPRLIVRSVACPLFVPVIEEGVTNGSIVRDVFDLYLAPLLRDPPEVVLLGCTHYPLFRPALSQYFPKDTLILDSAAAAADYLMRLLKENGLCAEPGRTGNARYYVTDRTPGFERLARRFLDAGDGEVIDIHMADVVN